MAARPNELTPASRGKNTYLSVKYKRIALRRGRVKAIVAIEHVILTATWRMLANGEVYTDPGADFYLKREPEQTKTSAIRQLQTLGYDAGRCMTARLFSY